MGRNTLLILVLLSIVALFTVTGLANSETFQSKESIANVPDTQELGETLTPIFDHGEKSQSPMEIPQTPSTCYHIFDIRTCINNCFKYSKDCATFKRCIKRCISNH